MVETFNLANFKYDINNDTTWIFKPSSMNNEFDILYLMDNSETMGSEINIVKELVINTLKE